jgi:cytochrome c556
MLPSPTRLALTLTIALAATPAALAADDVAYVEYRQKVMKGIGADMGAISDILKNGLPFTAAIAIHADKLGDASALIPAAFEKKVTEGLTDAKPAIWEKPDEWKDAIAALEEAADDLEEAADDGDPAAVKAAFKGLGKSCGGCHDTFRKPKEESYKRQ